MVDWQADRPLKWADFKAKPPQGTAHAALTYSGISLDLAFRNGTYDIEIKAQFDKTKSWHKKEANSDHLLNHEQLHFDITELHARKLRKALVTGRWRNSAAFEKAINEVYADNQQSLSNLQDQYDKATEHSLIETAQKEWEGMIADSLKAYDKFKGQHISLRL